MRLMTEQELFVVAGGVIAETVDILPPEPLTPVEGSNPFPRPPQGPTCPGFPSLPWQVKGLTSGT